MDPKGKGIVINDKEKESFVNEPKDDKPTHSGSGHRRRDGKKKKTRRIKEIVYYDNRDESTSSQKDNDDNDCERRKLWRNRPNYSSLSAQVAPLRGATHLNRNNPSVPRI
jgi:hypothetical protein